MACQGLKLNEESISSSNLSHIVISNENSTTNFMYYKKAVASFSDFCVGAEATCLLFYLSHAHDILNHSHKLINRAHNIISQSEDTLHI